MNIKYFIAFVLLFLVTNKVIAATPTATPSSEPANAIDDLKERLATKVAELRQTQKKAIAGTVKDVVLSTFTVGTVGSNIKIERTDDIKVFQMMKGKRTQLSTEDIEKGDYLTVFGEFDTGLGLLAAKVVFIQSPPLIRVSGVVKDIDRTEFTVTVITVENRLYVIDIEKNANALLFDKDKGLVKGGFSKLTVGNTVHVVGTAVPKQDNRVSASRLVDLGNVAGTTTPTITPSAEAIPPASASATPKATPKPSPTP